MRSGFRREILASESKGNFGESHDPVCSSSNLWEEPLFKFIYALLGPSCRPIALTNLLIWI